MVKFVEDIPEGEEIAWVCMLVSECDGPAIPWAKIGKCHDCKEEVWYDPQLSDLHPKLSLSNIICTTCIGKKIKDQDEVKLRFPHRDN